MLDVEEKFDELEGEPWYKGPIKYILGIFLILLLLVWLIPIYSVRLDPEPKNIPRLDEVLPSSIEVSEINRNSISLDMVDGEDPVIKSVADKIVVQSCGDRGKICHAKALFYFVRDNLAYVSDPNACEYVKTTKQSLVSGGGDCDDASVLVASLLDAVGIRTRFVFVPGHVFVQAHLSEALKKYKEEGEWVNLDATCNSCGFGEIGWSSVGKERRILGS